MDYRVLCKRASPLALAYPALTGETPSSWGCEELWNWHLQVGEPWHDHVHIQLCSGNGSLHEVGQIFSRVLQRAVQPQPRVRGHLQIETG